MAELKTQKNNSNVIDFLNSIENEQRKADCFKLLELFEQVTKEAPVMWGTSIVGFGDYHYKYDSGREGDWFLAGFSPRKQNLTIYLTAGCKGFNELMQELGTYKTGSSCLYVKKLADIDTDKLKSLIERSILYLKEKHS